MDPASLAGLGLGAASLAIQLLDGVRKGFVVLQGAANADVEYQAFKVHLQIELHRLEHWGEVTGLKNEDHVARYERQMKHNGALVVATLSQIKIVLKGLRRSELAFDDLTMEDDSASSMLPIDDPTSGTRVSDIAEPNAPVIGNDVLLTWDDLEGVQHMTPTKKPSYLKRSWAAAKKPVKQPKRFKWALHDKSKVEKGLVQVTSLVDYLHELLNQDQLTSLLESTDNFKLTLLQLSTNVSEMKALLQGGQDQNRAHTVASSSISLGGSTLVDADDTASVQHDEGSLQTVARTTAFWKAATQFSIAMSEKSSKAQPSHRFTQSERTHLSLGGVIDRDLRTMATMGNVGQCWVEWRRFETKVKVSMEGDVETVIPHATVERIEKLVALLREPDKPVEFCVPRCLGYFQEIRNKRFGIVFAPPLTRKTQQPQSLHSFLGTKGVKLGAKIAMAQDLAQWLLYLHAVNWLHKGIRSASVLFFPEPNTKHFGKPFVSGFEYSRIAQGQTTDGPTADDIERAMYTHPSYSGEQRDLGFKKTYDMYSLGIILVEIALWLPINEVFNLSLPGLPQQAAAGAVSGDDGVTQASSSTKKLQHLPPATARDVASFREQILEGPILEQVAERMGDAFAAATRVCIEGMTGLGFDGEQDEANRAVAAHIQQSFIENVVDVLKKISV